RILGGQFGSRPWKASFSVMALAMIGRFNVPREEVWPRPTPAVRMTARTSENEINAPRDQGVLVIMTIIVSRFSNRLEGKHAINCRGVRIKANRRVSLGGLAPVLMWLTVLTPANHWAEGFTYRPVA